MLEQTKKINYGFESLLCELSETCAITKQDAIFIAETVKEHLTKPSELQNYRLRSDIFTPPEPNFFSSNAYKKAFGILLKSPMHKSNELKIKLWALLSIESKTDTTDLSELAKEMDRLYFEWKSEAMKKSLSFNVYINEHIISSLNSTA